MDKEIIKELSELKDQLKEIEKEYKDVSGRYFKILCKISDLERDLMKEEIKNY